MNVALIIFLCSGRMCNWEPQYAQLFDTMSQCTAELPKHGNGARTDSDKAECVPVLQSPKKGGQ